MKCGNVNPKNNRQKCEGDKGHSGAFHFCLSAALSFAKDSGKLNVAVPRWPNELQGIPAKEYIDAFISEHPEEWEAAVKRHEKK